ncbi:MAG: hypothetical protein ACH34X_08795 [Thiolinea sp.]
MSYQKYLYYQRIKAEKAQEREELRRLRANEAERRYQANAEYCELIKGFEELREKFAEDERKRRGLDIL